MGNSCPMCGMRKAVDCILNLEFYKAYQSNPYIIALLLTLFIMFIDSFFIIKNCRHELCKL